MATYYNRIVAKRNQLLKLLRDKGYKASVINDSTIKINDKLVLYVATEKFCINDKLIGTGYANLINYLKTL